MTRFSTRQAVVLINQANPDHPVRDDDVRSAIRRDKLSAPALFAGRYAWTLADVQRLAEVTDRVAPSISAEARP